jgi:hypothetical protein
MNLYNSKDINNLNERFGLIYGEFYTIDVGDLEKLYYYFDGYAEVVDAVVNVFAADGAVRASYDAAITQDALSYYYNAE